MDWHQVGGNKKGCGPISHSWGLMRKVGMPRENVKRKTKTQKFFSVLRGVGTFAPHLMLLCCPTRERSRDGGGGENRTLANAE